jgi:hypothetical protein
MRLSLVDTPGLGCLHGIEDHRGGIGAGVLGDHRDAVAFAPDLQLLDRRRAEGIACGQHDLLAFALKLLRQLADGGGLARTVDTDDQDHERLVLRRDDQRLFDRAQQGSQFFLQGLVQGIGIGQLLARDFLGQALDDDGGRLDAHVGRQQAGLDLVEEIVVDGLFAKEQTGHALANAGAGLGQALLEAREEARLGVFHRLGDGLGRGGRQGCRYG